jgi:hypothetical protein
MCNELTQQQKLAVRNLAVSYDAFNDAVALKLWTSANTWADTLRQAQAETGVVLFDERTIDGLLGLGG